MLGGFAVVDVVMVIFALVITLIYTFRGFLKGIVQLFKTLIAFLIASMFGYKYWKKKKLSPIGLILLAALLVQKCASNVLLHSV